MAAVKKGRPSLFLEEPEPRTRLDLFLRSRDIRPMEFAREAGQSRQHLLRAKKGILEPTRRKIAAMVSAARRLTMEMVAPDDLFELASEEGGAWLTAADRRRAISAATSTARDRKQASELIASFATRPVAEWTERIRKRKSGATEPVIRRLIAIGYKELVRNATRAHAILAVARELTADLSQTIPELRVAFRGRTFLYQAHALLQMGRYDDALAALDDAEREYEGSPFSTNELAQTWYERAAIRFKRGELDEAARLIKRAINVFTVMGDTRRVAKARIIQGCILYERGNIAAAREQWLLVVEPLRLAEDLEAVAAISLNIGSAETLLGQVASAKVWLNRALAEFKKQANIGEIIRTQWSMAKLRLLHEDYEAGLRVLRMVHEQFISVSMPAEAGFVALDLVEQLVESSETNDDVIALCRSAITAFERAGATLKMLEALGYLREAIARRKADAELVRHVRKYLERVGSGRDEIFAPLES